MKEIALHTENLSSVRPCLPFCPRYLQIRAFWPTIELGRLFQKCKEVIAVELIETNIKDARKYADINGITNCEFIAGKIEDIIQTILLRLRNKKVVVILDPPRTGVGTYTRRIPSHSL